MIRCMATPVQVVFDCHDPVRVCEFWRQALGYELEWQWDEETTRWMLDGGLPDGMVGSRMACRDPDGAGPRLFFQRVPEEKVVKNRVHLDVHVGGDRLDAEVARLEGLGATVVRENVEQFGPLPEYRGFVMADPEGNEFCVS